MPWEKREGSAGRMDRNTTEIKNQDIRRFADLISLEGLFIFFKLHFAEQQERILLDRETW
jgi:hypothetical protein